MLPENWLQQRICEVEGHGGLKVMLLGEAPGEAEAATGLPFRPSAPAGSVLEKAIKRAGWTRSQFWLFNIVDRRPPKNWLEGAPWEQEMLGFCEPRLRETIERLRPGAIVTLGGVATRELTGLSGEKRSVSYLRGYVLPSRYGIPVIPSFHPAHLARGQSQLLGLLMRDLALAVAVAQGSHPGPCADPSAEMQVLMTLDDLHELYERAKADPRLRITYDIETDESRGEDEDELLETLERNREDKEDDSTTDGADEGGNSEIENPLEHGGRDSLDIGKASLRTIQFALDDREGVCVPWREGFVELARLILALPNPKAGQNIMWFDRPILQRHGCPVEGDEDDVMLMWKAMQPDLPAHLQAIAGAFGWPFPWKHLAGSNPDFYGVADVCSIHKIYPKLRAQLERAGLWPGYKEMTMRFRRAVLEPMEKRGLPLDRVRLDELRDWIGVETARMRGEIANLAPEDLNGRHPVLGYKVLPRNLRTVMEEHPDVQAAAKSKKASVLNMLNLTDPGFFCRKVIELGYGVAQFDGVFRAYEKVPFNPKSSKQMLAYLRYKGYPIPKRFKDGVDTTGDKELERLQWKTGDPMIKLSRELRVTEKMRDSYTGKPPKDDPEGAPAGGWIPDGDGRLRSTFTFKSTWQLAAYAPNVLTLPKKRPELAGKFRRCMVAEPGHRIVAFDYKSFHDLTTALEAQDEIKFRLARLDPHSFVAAHFVHYPGVETCLDLSDDDLKQYLKEVREKHPRVREYQAKPCIATGELVLTDKGLIPIENIRLEHKLWDGVEWVCHKGLVDKGIKEIIVYDGLKATPDHKVFTRSGRKITLREAARQLEGIEVAGIGGEEVRTRHNYFREYQEERRIYPSLLPMYKMWEEKLDIQRQSSSRDHQGMSKLHRPNFEEFCSTWTEIRWDGRTLQSSSQSSLRKLRWEGSTIELLIASGIHLMDGGEPSSSGLQGNRDRSDRQRWPLRTRESEIGDEAGTDEEQTEQHPNNFRGENHSALDVQESLYPVLDSEVSKKGFDWRADNRSGFNGEGTKSKELDNDRSQIERVRVYDILNAGPRNRFTVNGKLVANCNHGTNFGQGYRRLYFEYREHFKDETEAKRLLEMLRRIFPKTFKWQDDVCEEADRQGYLQTKWNARRWFWDVYNWRMQDGRWKRTNGKDAEKAKSYKPANDAHGMLRLKLLEMADQDWLEKYELINIPHDEVLMHPPTTLVDECIENVRRVMEGPVVQLADARLCPEGLVCGVDVSVGENRGEMEEVTS